MYQRPDLLSAQRVFRRPRPCGGAGPAVTDDLAVFSVFRLVKSWRLSRRYLQLKRHEKFTKDTDNFLSR
jgi:hypothetical protein